MAHSLIPVFTGKIKQEQITLVNARDLHVFLEVGKKFSDWIKDRIAQYEFIGNQDYLSISQNWEKPQAGRPATEYHITLVLIQGTLQ